MYPVLPIAALILCALPAFAQTGYPAPGSQAEVLSWPMQGGINIQRPGDPMSPRRIGATTGPRYDVHSAEAALADVASDTDLRMTGTPVWEKLEAWEKWDGREMHLALTGTRMPDGPGVAFALTSKPAGSTEYTVFVLEMPEPVFREWGGVMRMMLVRDLIPGMGAFPEDRRAEIAAAPFPQQVAVYEAALDDLLEGFAGSAAAASQGQILLRMQELNYDLLLGGDITSPFIAD